MKKLAARSLRFCDRRHASDLMRARRLWRVDMMTALRAIIEEGGMQNQWATDRVQALLDSMTASPPEQLEEMAVNLGGVRVTVSGRGVALVLAPGLRPQHADDQDHQ